MSPNGSAAGKQLQPSFVPGANFVLVALVLLGLVQSRWRPSALTLHLLYNLAGAFFIVSAGFLAAALALAARRYGRLQHKSFVRINAKRLWFPLDRLRKLLDETYAFYANIDWRGEWVAALGTLLLCSVALFCLRRGWPPPPAISANGEALVAGALIAATFPMLVLERYFASLPERMAPDGALLPRLLRVLILVFLAFALAAGLRWLDLPFALTLERAASLFTGLVAVEILLRTVARFFAPPVLPGDRRSHADSAIAGLIRARWPSFGAFSASVSSQFGIDLARSWAIGFIRRAALPVFAVMVLCGWLLTGIVALGLNERAVYEAFGRPQGVLHPGLHILLPWPLGILKPVEFGIVRDIPIVFPAGNGAPAEAETVASPGAGDIEGVPSAALDRLWDASHPSEASYLVASFSNGRQNFQVVNIDLRILYRIGLSDAAAKAAVYNIAAPEAAIRAAAGRMLARYFARYTILDILGQNREAFIRGFQRELQSRLTNLDSGIEIIGVVVEAIHPPAAAASAYQGVQSAAITSRVAVETARASATRLVNNAQQFAIQGKDGAAATAAERVDQANADLILFDADRQADVAGGPAFLLERRLEHVQKALARVPLTIIDHRLTKDEAPVLDERFSADATNPAPVDDDN